MTMMKIRAAYDSALLGGEPPAWAQDRQWVFLLTCYMLGGPEGRNLGAPGYSHDFVARLFRPILERWGEVIEVRDAPRHLQASVDECLRQGKKPIHFSVLPFQDVSLVKGAPNIVMPAWEYPDVPNESFDGNPQNDWPATADRCDLCLVSGPFTAAALRRGGATVPIRIVPVPTPAEYFTLPARTVAEPRKVACRGYVFPPSGDAAAEATAPVLAAAPRTQRAGKAIELAFRRTLQATLGKPAYERLSRLTKGLKPAHRRQPAFDLPYPRVDEIELSGVVFTSIFNPDDGRKNWATILATAPGWSSNRILNRPPGRTTSGSGCGHPGAGSSGRRFAIRSKPAITWPRSSPSATGPSRLHAGPICGPGPHASRSPDDSRQRWRKRWAGSRPGKHGLRRPGR